MEFTRLKYSKPLTNETVVDFVLKGSPENKITASPEGVTVTGTFYFEDVIAMHDFAKVIGDAWKDQVKIKKKVISLESMGIDARKVLDK